MIESSWGHLGCSFGSGSFEKGILWGTFSWTVILLQACTIPQPQVWDLFLGFLTAALVLPWCTSCSKHQQPVLVGNLETDLTWERKRLLRQLKHWTTILPMPRLASLISFWLLVRSLQIIRQTYFFHRSPSLHRDDVPTFGHLAEALMTIQLFLQKLGKAFAPDIPTLCLWQPGRAFFWRHEKRSNSSCFFVGLEKPLPQKNLGWSDMVPWLGMIEPQKQQLRNPPVASEDPIALLKAMVPCHQWNGWLMVGFWLEVWEF